jgi:glycosyltransferase involved in cell wall biosynthesis
MRRPTLKGLQLRAKRLIHRPVRKALIRYAKGRPRRGRDETPKVYIMLVSAWGMGGTIRAALNLAGWLAPHHEVEVLSVFRRREESFFGEFPPGIEVTALDDHRAGHEPKGPARLLRRALRSRSSVLLHPSDRAATWFNLWVDFQLVRKLRGRTGILVGTRPGLNFIAAELAPPGMVTVGLEQMHHHHHVKPLRQAMRRLYKRLDAFVVLTERDMETYGAMLDGEVRLVRIPNTAREMPGPKADLASRTVLAAGRLTPQKGFDLLIPAWAKIAGDHPDWRLRICGRGTQEEELRALVAEHGLEDVVTLPGPQDMSVEMAEASIFALSSRFEGFPLILLEAMSKAMAVVAFDCPTGPGDIIDDHENGLLVPEKDVDALAAALSEMMADEDLRRHCAPRAAQTAHEYTMEVVGPRWDALFDELRGARQGRAAAEASEPASR